MGIEQQLVFWFALGTGASFALGWLSAEIVRMLRDRPQQARAVVTVRDVDRKWQIHQALQNAYHCEDNGDRAGACRFRDQAEALRRHA